MENAAFDLAIVNGILADGSGEAAYAANLYVKDGKIARITPELLRAGQVYDARGHVAAPGFVDIHSHSDTMQSFRKTPEMESKLRQGVTFELTGQCGGSLVPRKDAKDPAERDVLSYAQAVREQGITIHQGMLVGHGTLRAQVVGHEMRQLTEAEREELCGLFEKMLLQGAAGISFGLYYAPGSFCNTEEVDALARTAARYDRLLAVHMRNENVKVFEAVDEMIGVALRTGVRMEISHLKLMGKPQWGRSKELLEKIDAARAQGARITCDQYPYTASYTNLDSIFPKELKADGREAFLKRIADDAVWAKLVESGLPEMNNRGGAENTIVSVVHADIPQEKLLFKSLTAIAEEEGKPLFDTIRSLVLRSGDSISCFFHCMDEQDVMTILRRKDVMIGSDGSALPLKGYAGHPHPRTAGTFPRFLRLARENALMRMEDAVRKITALPAQTCGYGDRMGLLKEGYDASITVFDWETVRDNATFEHPMSAPSGIDAVFVSGECVLDHGVITPNRPGRVILCVR